MKGRSLMSIKDLSKEELLAMLECSTALKTAFKDETSGIERELPLMGKSVAMIFQKRSTRTRVSTETGMMMLGGIPLFLGPSDIQLGVNESLKDTALVLGRFNSTILARVFSHKDVVTLKKESGVPVINALSDLHHPLQTLADLMTLQEKFGSDVTGKSIAWVGDGNNVLHDLMLGAAKLGINVRVCCPPDFMPDPGVTQSTTDLAAISGSSLYLCNDPSDAVKGCHAIFTDTWVSMGQEEEAAKRNKLFEGYQVTMALMAKADPDCVFMHCLPRHKQEVNDEVFYSDKSVVFQEAENRMWTVMAVLLSFLGK